MADWKDILSNNEEPLNEEDLKSYLQGDLTEQQKNSVEQKTSNSPFDNDALEGLQQFKNKQKLDDYVNQLNKNLHQQLSARKQRNERRRLKDNPWFILSIIIILSICIIAFYVVRMHNKNKAKETENSSQTFIPNSNLP